MTAHLKIKCHIPGMASPTRGHSTDAGLDLTAYGFEEKRHSVFFFDTGISVELTPGYYLDVVPRSSIVKTDFIMANSVGIIDPDYRGKIFIPLRYLGNGNGTEAAEALVHKRIAQIIIRRLEPCTVEEVTELEGTQRGEGGFGSTGA